jgi:hypothetical protein
MFQRSWKTVPEAKGYSWWFFYTTKSWLLGMFMTIAVVAVGGSCYVWYSQFGDDVAPDSMVGLIFAVAGTMCFILAALLYMIQRRSHRRAIGQLHASLQWHIFLAIMGLALLLMHSFGNFNARTGTYALYGLLALVVSGLVGCLVDRIMPRLIAAEVAKTLTAQGEDRVESISQQLQAFPLWMPDIQSRLAVVEMVQRAARREQFYRSVIRYWRIFHIALALLTLGLVIWHLVFVVQLLVFHMA